MKPQLRIIHIPAMILCVLLIFSCVPFTEHSNGSSTTVITVNGPIPADSLGLSLIHEHVFLDWAGPDSMDRARWNTQEAFDLILPYLIEMKAQGVRTFMECTPAYLGRNPNLLKRLSEASGLQILTNTGYYAARKNKYVPQHAFEISVNELAGIWIEEFANGIEESDVFPGFIKIGMDSKENLTDIDVKLVRAAARTHLATGLSIVAHGGTDTTAIQELEILKEEGVAPNAFVWTHAQNGTKDGHIRMAQLGAWVSLDGLGWVQPNPSTADSSALFKYVYFLENLKEKHLLNRTLIAHDAGWYTVGATNQETFKPYTPIFNLLIPVLKKRGFMERDIQQLLIENPKEAYAINKRKINEGG